MDHGSHTFYLAFEWMRSYPLSITAKSGTLGAFDTEDNFSCTLTFPTGIATAHLTWTAGVRKVLYTLHGERGAITVDDDVVTVHANARGSSPERPVIAASHWMDASHKEWFGGMFDEFRAAIHSGIFVGSQALDAVYCVETIGAAYESASQGSREVPILAPRHGHEAFVRRPNAAAWQSKAS